MFIHDIIKELVKDFVLNTEDFKVENLANEVIDRELLFTLRVFDCQILFSEQLGHDSAIALMPPINAVHSTLDRMFSK